MGKDEAVSGKSRGVRKEWWAGGGEKCRGGGREVPETNSRQVYKSQRGAERHQR